MKKASTESNVTSPKDRRGELNKRLRKKIERLEATEQNFRVLCENVPAFFAYIGADERYVFANKLHETLFGIPSEEIAGMRLPELIGDEAYEYAKPHIDRVLSGDEVRDEAEVPVRDRRLSIRLNLMPDIDESGCVAGFFALATDDTREKEAARAVQESRDRLASVLKTVAEAIVSIDRTGRIDGFNPAAERMFGYAADEVIGENVRILMPEPYRSEHDRYIERYLETSEAKVIGKGRREAVGQRKDGTKFPIELAVSQVDHQERFTGIIRDITTRKKTEAALELNREELRMLSARLLTAEESERRRISRELHDDINQRLAMLSIDLEGLAAAEGLGARTRATLGELRDQVSSLSDDVHAMAYRLHPAILDDLGLPAAVRALLGDFSQRHGISVSFRERHFPTQIGMELSSCLYRVVQESLTNIARHSESVSVRIRLLGTPRGVRLSIRDFGLGFDVQGARNHKRSLGIVSMEERVRLAGGLLSIWSSPGKGTRIFVTIPFSS